MTYPAHEVLAVLHMMGCIVEASQDGGRLVVKLPYGLTGYQRKELVRFAREHKTGLLELLAGCPLCGGVDWWQGLAGQPVCRRCHPPAPDDEMLTELQKTAPLHEVAA